MSTTRDNSPMPPRPSSGQRVEFQHFGEHLIGDVVDCTLMAAWREADYRLTIEVDGIRVTKPSSEVEVV